METVNFPYSPDEKDSEPLEVVEVDKRGVGRSPAAPVMKEPISADLIVNESTPHNSPAMNGGVKCSYCDFLCFSIVDRKRHEKIHSHTSLEDRHEDPREAGLQVEDEVAISQKHLPSVPLEPNHCFGSRDRQYEKKFQCDVCITRCSNAYLLELHKCQHSDARPYACDQCDLKFKHTAHLRRHTAKQHKGSINCEEPMLDSIGEDGASVRSCESVSSILLAKSSSSMASEQKWSCHFCNQEFASQHSLLRHERIHANPLACQICDKVLSSSAAFQLHKNTHSVELPYGCNRCEEKFRRKAQLERHKASCKHRQASLPGDSRNNTPLGDADDVLTESSMLDHGLDYLEEAPSVICIENSEAGSTRDPGNFSELSSNWKAFICPICGKGLSSKTSLISHTRLHNGLEQPRVVHEKSTKVYLFSCTKCAFQTKDQTQMKEHRMRHMDSQPVECDLCGGSYKSKTGLKRHKTVKHKGLVSSEAPMAKSRKFSSSDQAPDWATKRHPSDSNGSNSTNKSLTVFIEIFGRSSEILSVLWIEEFDRSVLCTLGNQSSPFLVYIRTLDLNDPSVKECLSSLKQCDAAVHTMDHQGSEERLFMLLFRGGRISDGLRGPKFHSYTQLSSMIGEYAKSIQMKPINIVPRITGDWYSKFPTELKGPLVIANEF